MLHIFPLHFLYHLVCVSREVSFMDPHPPYSQRFPWDMLSLVFQGKKYRVLFSQIKRKVSLAVVGWWAPRSHLFLDTSSLLLLQPVGFLGPPLPTPLDIFYTSPLRCALSTIAESEHTCPCTWYQILLDVDERSPLVIYTWGSPQSLDSWCHSPR